MSNLKIHELIPKAMEKIGAIGKNGTNKDQHYSFRTIDDMYNKIQPVLTELKVFIVPQVLESKLESFSNNNGKRSTHVSVRVKYTIYASDGSSIEAITQGESIDTSDKGSNKAITAAFKYMLIQLFCIAIVDQDDADKETPVIEAQAPRPQAAVKPALVKPPPPKSNIPAAFIDEDYGAFKCSFGKHKDKAIKDFGEHDLDGFVVWLKKQPQLSPSASIFLEKAEAYLATLEFKREAR